MIYSNEFIKKIKSCIDLQELVSNYTSLKKVGNGLWNGKCPHPDHKDDTPSFVVYNKDMDDQNWTCYGCHCDKKNSDDTVGRINYGNDCIAFIQWITDYKGSKNKMTFKQAIEYLAEYAGIPLEEDRFKKIYADLKTVALNRHKDLLNREDLLKYLYGRGLNINDINYYVIGYNKEKDRISFPLPNMDSNVIAFSDRRLPTDTESVKYINSATSDWFHKGAYFYGINSFDRKLDYAFITEGVFDVILPQKYGVPNVLGTLGTAFTEQHAQFLANAHVVPIFCQDNDSAGRDAVLKSVNMMADLGVNSKICVMKYGKDMADMANKLKRDLYQYLVNQSVYFGYYFLNNMYDNFDRDMYDLRMQYLPKAMSLIEKVPSKHEQELLKYELYKKMGGKSFNDML